MKYHFFAMLSIMLAYLRVDTHVDGIWVFFVVDVEDLDSATHAPLS